jgi:hypothetical protein
MDHSLDGTSGAKGNKTSFYRKLKKKMPKIGPGSKM